MENLYDHWVMFSKQSLFKKIPWLELTVCFANNVTIDWLLKRINQTSKSEHDVTFELAIINREWCKTRTSVGF